MKWLVDNNVFFPAIDNSHPDHVDSRLWLDQAKKDGWAVTVETFLGVIRKLMNPVIMQGGQLKAPVAVDAVCREMAAPNPGQILIGGSPDKPLLKTAQGHRQVMDFYLAQVARDAGLKLATRDKGLLAAFPKIAVYPS